MRANKGILPKLALDFLKLHPSHKDWMMMRVFYRWMKRWQLCLQDLRPAHIASFIDCPKVKRPSKGTRAFYRGFIIRYLMWLHAKKMVRFDPRHCGGRCKPPLSDLTERYIQSLEPTLKKSTLTGRRATLRRFHWWLDDQNLSLDILERRHLCAWIRTLSGAKLAAKTINHNLIYLRIYLRWLDEQGVIANDPNDLIRVSDMVKEPKYLPRPLPPETDIELQARLAKATDLYSLGLLLMRKTGLRIGELISLENNCLRHDHLGNRFLKVPLGKLNTERLVPIDDETESLISKLKTNAPQTAHKTFLLENKKGMKTRYPYYVAALKQASEGLETNGPLGTHRLRHTFATTLLNAGMSLVGLMKLLGHNDHRMTLRYAEVTQETVRSEYFEAIARIDHRYAHILNQLDHLDTNLNPIQMLQDVVHLIQNISADDHSSTPVARALVKRIQRIQTDIQTLFQNKNINP